MSSCQRLGEGVPQGHHTGARQPLRWGDPFTRNSLGSAETSTRCLPILPPPGFAAPSPQGLWLQAGTPGLRLGVESKTPARVSPAWASQACVTPSTGPGRVGLLPQTRQHSCKALGVRVGKVFLPQVLAELAPLPTVWHSFFKATQRTPSSRKPPSQAPTESAHYPGSLDIFSSFVLSTHT